MCVALIHDIFFILKSISGCIINLFINKNFEIYIWVDKFSKLRKKFVKIFVSDCIWCFENIIAISYKIFDSSWSNAWQSFGMLINQWNCLIVYAKISWCGCAWNIYDFRRNILLTMFLGKTANRIIVAIETDSVIYWKTLIIYFIGYSKVKLFSISYLKNGQVISECYRLVVP